ncbi:MAG: tetratricopeptide repeat protein [Labrys sp. (in: a-proteobacteria)]
MAGMFGVGDGFDAGAARQGRRGRGFSAMLLGCAVAAVLTLGACSDPAERAASYYASGQAFLEKGDFARAAIEFRNALKIKEDYADAWFAMAKIEANAKQWNRVAGNLQRTLEINPTHYEALRMITEVYLNNGNIDAAMKQANAALAINPKDEQVLALRGAAFARQDKMTEALADANAALAINPNHPGALLLLAADKLRKNELKEALTFIDKGIAANPRDAALLIARLSILERQNDVAGQEVVLKQLIEANPETREYRQALLTYYMRNNRADDAERELRVLAQAEPKNADKQLEVVRFLRQTKGVDAAREELRKLASSGSNVATYKIALAQLEASDGKSDAAKAILAEVIASEGTSIKGIEARLELGAVQLRADQIDAVRQTAEEVLKIDGRNVGALRLRAVARIDRAEFEAAVNDLRAAINDEPKNAELRQLLAVGYEGLGSIELAAKELTEAVKLSEWGVNEGLTFVQFLIRRGRLEQAEDVLLELNARRGNDARVFRALADVRIRRQNWSGAQEVAKALAAIGDDPRITDQINAASLLATGKVDEGLDALRQAVEAAPQDISALSRLARGYVANGRNAEARSAIDAALAANPDNVAVMMLSANLHRAEGAGDKARDLYTKILELSPESAVAWQALADFQIASGQIAEAVETLRKGLDVAKPNQDVRFTLAGAYERLGEYEKAIAEYEILFKEDPTSILVANNLASMLTDRRNDPESLERAAAMAAILRDSPLPQFRDTLGWVLVRKGDYREGVRILETTAAELPTVMMAQYHLARGYAGLGDKKRALEVLTKAQKLEGSKSEKEKVAAALRELQPASQ